VGTSWSRLKMRAPLAPHERWVRIGVAMTIRVNRFLRYGESVPEQPFIAVTGTGVAMSTPDQCKLQVALNCMTENAADALTKCAEMASMAIAAVGEVALEQRDVQTVGLSVHDYHDQSKQRVTAKIGTYQLEIVIQPIDGVGSVLAALGSSAGDGLQVRGIQLSVRDPEPLKSEARRLAVKDAQKKAMELSQAAGFRLGVILALEDDNARSPIPQVRYARAMAASSGPTVPIEPGEVSAVSSITITYAIEP